MASERYGLHKKLVERFGAKGDALHMFVAASLALAVSGFGAYLLNQPLLFPSLGPTVFLVFETPMATNASPRNTVIGHSVALGVGVFSLAIFGLIDEPSVLQAGVTLPRVGAATLSLALTEAVLILIRALHAPSGATVLIVSLGLLHTPTELATMVGGVVLLTATAWVINRASGIPVPIWSRR